MVFSKGKMMYPQFIKPSLDFLVAFFLLLILSPILVLLIFVLFLTNKGSIFFLQSRPGFNAIPFKIIKFKTMRDELDSFGKPLPDHERITAIGKFIRRASLDELLQLVNVIKGEMSLVGPRPLLMQYLTRYSKEQARRHDVKPGITGWAQVNGRNTISWEEKFRLDVYYVDHQTFFFDLSILWKTFLKVLARKDVNASENLTMSEFLGNETQST
jgi:lipopolysaccharide/colanic/teichoic acid biosynthesis glycosyltransferase